MMITSNIILGMPHSELLVRGAIEAGLDDIRKNPWLLDYCFSWFVNDTLTNQKYGEQARDFAINWVKNTEIFVSMGYRLDLPRFPMISIVQKSSGEDYSTLGDVNTDTVDMVNDPTPIQINPSIALGPFSGSGYNYVPSTGVVTLPTDLSTFSIAVGMILFDSVNNQQFPILKITSSSQFTIAKNVTLNLQNAYIASAGGLTATVESCQFRESYEILCTTQNSAEELFFLETLVQFVLLRYKQAYLEGRGFDRTTISLGPVFLNQTIGTQERVFCRSITLNGYVYKTWPKFFDTTFQGVNAFVKIDNIQNVPVSTPPALVEQVSQSDWELSGDSILGSAPPTNIPGNT